MDGLHVVYVPLSGDGPDRVRKAEASAAAKLIGDALHGDLLLVMTRQGISRILSAIYMNILHSTTAPPLLQRLKEMLGNSARADIAVGYFFISGFEQARSV